MPAYRCRETIDTSIKSVLQQTYRQLELIIVLDGADVALYRSIKRISDLRLRIFMLKENKGAAAARNYGLDMAQGRFIAFLDSDDYWLPTKLEHQLTYFTDTVGVVASDYYFCFADLTPKSVVRSQRHIDHRSMRFRNKIGNLTGIYDRKITGIVKQRENIKHEDYQMWIDLLKLTDGINVQEPLAMYRSGNSSSLSGNKLRAGWWNLKIIKENYGMYCAIISVASILLNHIRKKFNLKF